MARGLRPLRHLTGAQTFRTRMYPAIASGAMYIGDLARVSVGVVKPAHNSSATVLGAVAAVYSSAGRPRTHALPDGNIGKPAGTGGIVAVYDDPDIIYEVTLDGSASAQSIGLVVSVTAGTPNTAAGQSGMIVKAAASAGEGVMTVIGLSTRDNVTQTSAGTVVEVVIQRDKHLYG